MNSTKPFSVKWTWTNLERIVWKMRLESKVEVSRPIFRGHGKKCRDRCCESIYVFVARETSRKSGAASHNTLCVGQGPKVSSRPTNSEIRNGQPPDDGHWRLQWRRSPPRPVGAENSGHSDVSLTRSQSNLVRISPCRAVSFSWVDSFDFGRPIRTESDGFEACGYVGRQVSTNWMEFSLQSATVSINSPSRDPNDGNERYRNNGNPDSGISFNCCTCDCDGCGHVTRAPYSLFFQLKRCQIYRPLMRPVNRVQWGFGFQKFHSSRVTR